MLHHEYFSVIITYDQSNKCDYNPMTRNVSILQNKTTLFKFTNYSENLNKIIKMV